MSEYKTSVVNLISKLKDQDYGDTRIPSPLNDGVYLIPVTNDCDTDAFAQQLTTWRRNARHAFPRIHEFTVARTQRWLQESLLARPDRLLFMVIDGDDREVGHMGVSNFCFERKVCDLDNVLRGLKSARAGAMYSAGLAIFGWIAGDLGIARVRLRVFNELTPAILLYHRWGFRVDRLIPMAKYSRDQMTYWEEAAPGQYGDRIYLEMSMPSGAADEASGPDVPAGTGQRG